jgi:hypothetical protein
MRRVLALPVLAIALLAAAGVGMAAGDAKGPPCTDISFTNGDVSRTSRTVDLTLFLPTASCKSATYTLVVLDEAGDLTPLATDSAPGDGDAFFADGRDIVTLQATETAPLATDEDVCVYATSTFHGRVADRAPDATADPNCVTLTQGSPGGGGGFN